MNKKEINNMDWIAKMKTAMKLIRSACHENPDWDNCIECPFTTYCDVIYWHVSRKIPNDKEWIKEGGEDIK